MTDEMPETLDMTRQTPAEGGNASSEEMPASDEAMASLPDRREPVPQECESATTQVPQERTEGGGEEASQDEPTAATEDADPQMQAEGEVAAERPGAEEPQLEQDVSEEPQDRPADDEQGEATVESVVEAILFATDEPLTESRLANIVEITTKQVRESVKALNQRYEEGNNAFRIERIAGGYQMLTLSLYNNWLKKMLRTRSETKLSPAAMETLAIIAYKQPIIRADVEAIRGVAVGEVIRSLMYKGVVKIVGRAEILGRPMLYGTTRKFLEVFGLNALKDLPKAEELKNPDRG